MKKEEEKLAKLLTGEHITGLSENSPLRKVADELEGDEYVQFPDNTTQRVEGKKHTKGGEDMVLPNGTKVLTASIKLGARDAKKISDQLGFKVSKDDTFAKVLDKFKKNVGLEKLNEEQEDYIKEQMKLEESNTDPGSLRVNQEFISSKINDIENKKKELENEKASVFKLLYNMQEQKKEGKAKYQKEGMMKYGGTMKPKREKTKFKVGGRKKTKYDRGGEIKSAKDRFKSGDMTQEEYMKLRREIASKYDTDYNPSTDTAFLPRERGGPEKDFAYRVQTLSPEYTEGEFVKQPERAEGAFGTLTEKGKVVQALENLKTQFPAEWNDNFSDKSVEDVASSVVANKKSGKIEKLQGDILKRQKQQANFVINHKDDFTEDEIADANRYLQEETFIEKESDNLTEAQRVRLTDDMLGNFTSSRFAMGIDLVTPEDKQKLLDSGITTTGQLKNLDDLDIELSQESKNRIEDFKELKGTDDDPNFALFDFTPQEPATIVPEEAVEENIVQEEPVRRVKADYPRAYYMPDQSVLPPGGLEAHTKIQNRLGRIDAPRVGVEDQLQQASNQRRQMSEQLRDLPPTQRAAAIANMTGQLQTAENQAITAANRTNMQNQARTEMFNVQQADKENVYAGNNALNFEQRQLTAKAKTDEELRNYLDYNRKVALTNFRNTQDRNLIASVFPDYDTDFYGMKPVYEPEDPNWTVEDRSKRIALQRAMGVKS